jgi:hypothetical protein
MLPLAIVSQNHQILIERAACIEMKFRLRGTGLGLFVGLALASAAAFADPIVGSGSFDADGTIYTSTTAFDFGFSAIPPPGDQQAAVALPTVGVFSYLTFGTIIPVGNLNAGATTITSSELDFDGAEPDWISLPANTGKGLPGIDLSLADILINTGVPLCSAVTSVDTPGTSCRPYASSPLTLHQNSGSVTVALNVNGNAYYVGGVPSSGTQYTGKLSMMSTGADGTISGWLADFAATGSFTSGYNANFSTRLATAVPEPGALPILGVALFAIFLICRKKRSAA